MSVKSCKKFKLNWLLFLTILLLSSCRKEISNPGAVAKNAVTVTNANVNVYVARTENNKPIYWMNNGPV